MSRWKSRKRGSYRRKLPDVYGHGELSWISGEEMGSEGKEGRKKECDENVVETTLGFCEL